MRPIKELIWHCTATPEGREHTVQDIDSWHKARGWTGIGYHKVVHLDGRVSNGRPESQVGAHVANHNTGTIGYVYIGGTAKESVKIAKDTRTPAQKATMLRLTKEAIAKYGITKVSGHSDYANKACPCFNARAEYAHLLRPAPQKVAAVEDESDKPEFYNQGAGRQPDDPGGEQEEMSAQAKPPWYKRAGTYITGTLAGGIGLGGFTLDGDTLKYASLFVVVAFIVFLGYVYLVPPRGAIQKGWK